MGIATQYEGGLKFDGNQMYITTSGGTTLLTLGNTGNATFAGTIGATNFSGSSSGTNTGDQTLPTLSSLGALSTSAAASTYLPLAGGTMTGALVAPRVSLTLDTGNNVNSRVTVYESGATSYGMMLWNDNATSGDWATMIYGPNQGNRKISFGKANSNFPGTKASVDELAYVDLDNGNFVATGTLSGTNFSGSSSGTNTGDQTFATLGAATRTNYTLKFKPPSNSYAGFQFLGTNGQGAGYFLVRGTSDNDVYAAEGITLVGDQGWLTLAHRYSTNKGIRFMTGNTSSSTRMTIASDGDININNNLTVGSDLGVNGFIKDGLYKHAGNTNWRTKKYVRSVGITGGDIGDSWVQLSRVVISSTYEKVTIKFTINGYDDVSSGVEAIDVRYENGSAAQENHQCAWYSTDDHANLFKNVRSIRSASDGLSNTYDLYVQMAGDWRDNFTVVAEEWTTHGDDASIVYTTANGSATEPSAGSNDIERGERRWYTENSYMYLGSNRVYTTGDFTNNSSNWDTAYTDRNKWDGGSTGLTASTGRASLGLGTAATAAATAFATSGHNHAGVYALEYELMQSDNSDRDMHVWRKNHAMLSDDSGISTYIIVQTNVPQDNASMGGFTLVYQDHYSSGGEGGEIKIYGYWNAESNGGFIGFRYECSNPYHTPTIEVCRNSTSGNTAFFISGEGGSYTQLIAKDLWLGYAANSATSQWGDSWTVTQADAKDGYTNFDTLNRNDFAAITTQGSTPSLTGGVSAAEIRTLIGAGTGSSDLVIGTTATTAMAGNTAFASTAQGTTADAALPKAGGTMSGTMKVTGSIIHEHNSNSGYIAFPKGGMYQSTANNHTGAIKIKLPTHGGDDMMKFTVDIYDYATEQSVTVLVSGYIYQASGGNEWVNCTAVNLAHQTAKNYTVRWGGDGSNSCVWIGETDSTWNHLQVAVTNFWGGFYTDIDAYDDNWEISIVTAFGDHVDEVRTNNFPAADYNKIINKPSLFDGAYSSLSGKPTLGTAAAAATTDFATAAQGTLADSALQSLPSHNHDDRYFRRYTGQASSISSTAYRTAFTVAGGNLASSIRFSVQGTTGNVVVSNVIDVIANHSQDILIEATSGVYTRLYVKVVSDSNEDFAVELKTNHANAVTLDIEVLAYGNETVTFTTSHSFTGTSLELDCEPGKTFKATGGDSGDIKTYGVFKGDGSGLTGITKAATVSDQASPTADIQIGAGTSNTGNRSDVALLGATNAGGVVNALGLLNTASGGNSNGVALNFHNGNNYSPTGQIIVQQNSSGTAAHAAMKFFTYGSNNLTHQMSIKSDGVVRFLSYGTGILSTDTNGNISAISDGTSGQVLTTNGSGGFSFTTVTSGTSYTLPTASESVLGGIKVGDNLTITEGVLSATDTDTVYTHPTGDGNNHIPTGGAAGQFLKYSSSGAATWATPSYTTNTDTVYTHPTSAGNKHIPTGGAAGQFLKYSSSGTATWATPSYTTNTNTTYSAGTGLELSGTTFKLNGGEIAASVNLNTMRSTGIFAQNSNNDTTSGSNWPTNNAGILEVWNDDYGNGLHCTQRYSRYNTTDVYQRNYYNGTWTSWRNLTQDTNTNTTYSAGGGLDLTSTTFSVEPDLRDGITHVGKDANNYIQFDSTNGRIDFYAGGVFVARMESDGDLHMKGDVIAYSDIFS